MTPLELARTATAQAEFATEQATRAGNRAKCGLPEKHYAAARAHQYAETTHNRAAEAWLNAHAWEYDALALATKHRQAASYHSYRIGHHNNVGSRLEFAADQRRKLRESDPRQMSIFEERQ